MEHANVSRISVIRPGALGDTLLAFPALGWLRHRFPSADLTLIARFDVLLLARRAGLAKVTWTYDLPDWAPLFAESITLSRTTDRTRKAFGQADVVIAWLNDLEGNVARNLDTLGVRRTIIAPGPPSEAQPLRHAALRLCDALRPLATPDMPLPQSVGDLLAYLPTLVTNPETIWALKDPILSQRMSEIVAHWKRPSQLVALHPGSGGAAKRWAPANFAALARLLSAAGYQPLLIEGPQDGAVCADVLALAPEMPVARELPLTTLAALLRQCAVYVGNDSGVSHLAGLLDVPTVVIFGPTNPALWAPVGRTIHIVRAPAGDLTRLLMEQVWETLSKTLEWR